MASITGGTPIAITAPIDTSDIDCVNLSASNSIIAANSVQGNTVSAIGNVVAGGNVSATSDLTCEGLIYNNAGAAANPSTTEIGKAVAVAPGSQVQANQQLFVNGPSGLGEVYDDANNRIVPGANTIIAQYNSVIVPALGPNPYLAPISGTYVFTIQATTSNGGFSWTTGTTYINGRLEIVGIGQPETQFTIPLLVAPSGLATNTITNNYDIICDLVAGQSYSLNLSTDGGVINLGAFGGLTVILQPLIAP